MVEDFFIHTFSSQRQSVGSNGNSSLQTILTNRRCLVTKRDDEAKEIADGLFGMARTLYCDPGLDVRVGDVITSGGLKYGVRGVDPDIPDMFENTDSFSAYKIVLTNQ